MKIFFKIVEGDCPISYDFFIIFNSISEKTLYHKIKWITIYLEDGLILSDDDIYSDFMITNM